MAGEEFLHEDGVGELEVLLGGAAGHGVVAGEDGGEGVGGAVFELGLVELFVGGEVVLGGEVGAPVAGERAGEVGGGVLDLTAGDAHVGGVGGVVGEGGGLDAGVVDADVDLVGVGHEGGIDAEKELALADGSGGVGGGVVEDFVAGDVGVVVVHDVVEGVGEGVDEGAVGVGGVSGGGGGGPEVDVGAIRGEGVPGGDGTAAEGGAGEFGIEEGLGGVEDVGGGSADLEGGDVAPGGVEEDVEIAVVDGPAGAGALGDGDASAGVRGEPEERKGRAKQRHTGPAGGARGAGH